MEYSDVLKDFKKHNLVTLPEDNIVTSFTVEFDPENISVEVHWDEK